MTALIVQGRLNSTRLPKKSLLPLGDQPLIVRVMEALTEIPCDVRILACPRGDERSFGPLTQKTGFELVGGSEDDVLARYCMAIRRYSPRRIIRATADNPFVFADAAGLIAAEAAALESDYAGYAGLPLGAGVEAVSAEALLQAERESSSAAEREHVCPYLYAHGERFRLHRPLAPVIWQAGAGNIRLTVDTPEDYSRAQKLYEALSAHTSGAARYRGSVILNIAARLAAGTAIGAP